MLVIISSPRGKRNDPQPEKCPRIDHDFRFLTRRQVREQIIATRGGDPDEGKPVVAPGDELTRMSHAREAHPHGATQRP